MNLNNVVYKMNVDFFRMLCWKHTLFRTQKIVWASMTLIVNNVSKNMTMYNLWDFSTSSLSLFRASLSLSFFFFVYFFDHFDRFDLINRDLVWNKNTYLDIRSSRDNCVHNECNTSFEWWRRFWFRKRRTKKYWRWLSWSRLIRRKRNDWRKYSKIY
jgi:hypothetical protein